MVRQKYCYDNCNACHSLSSSCKRNPANLCEGLSQSSKQNERESCLSYIRTEDSQKLYHYYLKFAASKTYKSVVKNYQQNCFKMSGSDLSLYNQIYNNIDRPYANVDLSQMPWELVIKIMEQQALEARHVTEQMMPQTITNFDYHQSQQCNYNQNGINSTDESDNTSSCFSDERMSSPEPSDLSLNESDIEIDVDSVEEESEDYFIPSHDNIPITVLHFERSLREKELKKKC